jgi:hypothetical protein
VRFDRVAAFRPPVLWGLGCRVTSLLPYGETADGSCTVCTDSGPGWSTIATGVWPGKHGVTGNDFAGADYARYPDFLTRAKTARPELETAAVLSWGELARHGTFGEAIDVRVVLDGERDTYRVCDERAAAVAVRLLAERAPDATFVYFGGTDEVAHKLGPMGDDYRDALLRQDAQLGRLLDAIRSRAAFPAERWTVLVTTDHGHLDEGGHGGDSAAERTVFVAAAELGSATPLGWRRADLVDVAPTVLDRLGVRLDPTWSLDGRPAR